jgi:hypothetical protein
MNLTVPNGIQKGDPITAAFLSDLCRAVKAITPQSSADILVSTTSGGTTFRQTYRPGGSSQASILYGTAAADYSSGSTISLTPCDANGVATGESAVTCSIPTSWGTVNLHSVTVAGSGTLYFEGLPATAGCKLAAGTVIAYAYAASGTPYLLGDLEQVIQDVRYNNHFWQVKVYWIVGTAVSTVSDWLDVRACTQVTAITAWRVDSSSGEIQKKTQAFYAPEVGSESAWTKIDDTTESKPSSCTAQAS